MDCSNQPGATTTMRIARLDENPQTAANPSMVKIARRGAWGAGAGTVSNYILSFKSPSDWDGDSMLETCKDLDTARFILTPLIRPPFGDGIASLAFANVLCPQPARRTRGAPFGSISHAPVWSPSPSQTATR